MEVATPQDSLAVEEGRGPESSADSAAAAPVTQPVAPDPLGGDPGSGPPEQRGCSVCGGPVVKRRKYCAGCKPRSGGGHASRWTGEAVPPVLPKDPVAAARVRAAWQMAHDGMTIVGIANALGVKKSTASMYLNDPDGSRLVARKLTYAGVCIDCGGPTNGTASGVDRAPERCSLCMAKRNKECIVCRIHKNDALVGQYRWSDEQIFAAIRSCIGGDGNATVARYRSLYADSPKGSMPSLPTILQRFNTWNEACGAGQIQHGAARRTYTRISVEECLTAVVWVAQEIGRLPTITEYEARARELDHLPSVCTVRNRVGSWADVLRALHVEPKALAA